MSTCGINLQFVRHFGASYQQKPRLIQKIRVFLTTVLEFFSELHSPKSFT